MIGASVHPETFSPTAATDDFGITTIGEEKPWGDAGGRWVMGMRERERSLLLWQLALVDGGDDSDTARAEDRSWLAARRRCHTATSRGTGAHLPLKCEA